MSNNQFAEQWRQMAVMTKIQSFGSHWSEIKEHLVVWGIIPTLGFILFRTYAASLFGWWLPQVVGGFFFCSLWYVDQQKTGNYFWAKRIAHLAIAYILASTYNLQPLQFK